jgi:hypothetical protein
MQRPGGTRPSIEEIGPEGPPRAPSPRFRTGRSEARLDKRILARINRNDPRTTCATPGAHTETPRQPSPREGIIRPPHAARRGRGASANSSYAAEQTWLLPELSNQIPPLQGSFAHLPRGVRQVVRGSRRRRFVVRAPVGPASLRTQFCAAVVGFARRRSELVEKEAVRRTGFAPGRFTTAPLPRRCITSVCRLSARACSPRRPRPAARCKLPARDRIAGRRSNLGWFTAGGS